MNPTSLQNGFVLTKDIGSVPPTETPTDTMDVRTFFTPKTKTIETAFHLDKHAESKGYKPAWKKAVQALVDEGYLVSVMYVVFPNGRAIRISPRANQTHIPVADVFSHADLLD